MFTDSQTFINTMLQDIQGLYGNYYLVAILTLFLGIATYTDMKSMKIPNKLNLTFGIIAIGIIPFMDYSTSEIISRITGSLFGFFVLLIPAMIKMHKMGGDIKCIAVVGLYLGFFQVPIFLVLACISGMVYIYFRFRTGKPIGNMPFAPFFLLAHISLFFGQFLIPYLHYL
ncbi:prepilin peptidase [Bacillus sp. M6-12]|uniref:prepilin peptidase n=1 Tax=Bacillus sp. M6-12 TaxID=2054166 RepID=UPI00215516CE|nr:prepilin peptidase [Bacillus sp. M6-12]